MAVDISAIYQSTLEHFNQARNNIRNTTVMFEHSAAAISDVIPGFEADKLEFGSYDKENYAVLFVDMRAIYDACAASRPGKDIPNNARLSHGTIRSRQTLSRESN